MTKAQQLLSKARENGYAIGAFNAANIETLIAIARAAKSQQAPVIIESSPGETKFFGAQNMADMVKNLEQEYGIPILLNLDHAPSLEKCQAAMEAGYDLIHIDSGETESWDEKVAMTKQVVEMAHAKNLLVEGEIDHITGSSSLHTGQVEAEQQAGTYTDPQKAAEFVRLTGIDTFASFVGNVHGVYDNPPQLDIERLKQIKQATGTFLSLHGGSGIPDDQVRAAIEQGGIVKVNVNTEMRMAFRETLEATLKADQDLAMYKIMPPVIDAVQQVVERKIKLFGSSGQA